MRWLTLLTLGTTAACQCGPGSSTITDPGRNHDAGNRGGADAGSGSDGGSHNPGGDGGSGCSDQAKLVYVIDTNNTFSSFHPGPTPSFTDLGQLNCPAQAGSTPFSMSVDRNAVAWVLYSSGEVFKVDTLTVACSATTFQPNQNGFFTFGMGFVANSAGGTVDTLFIASSGSLGILDTSALTVRQVGTLGGQPELTGTGDAKLFGFYPDPTNPRVSQLDKNTGAESTSYPLQSLSGNPEDWAFAFWGGDFWIFLKRDVDNSTNVWHLTTATGVVTEPLSDTGRHIVGAGVSTCAPIVPQ